MDFPALQASQLGTQTPAGYLPVGSNDSYAGLRVHADIDTFSLENHLLGRVTERHGIQLQQWRRQLVCLCKFERHDVVILWWLQNGQLFEDLDFALSLSCAVGIVSPTIYESLEMGPVLHLCIVFASLIQRSLGLSCVELSEVAFEVVKRLVYLPH